MGILYYGDNLDILREHIKDETIDLIYLDPPFNSNKAYSLLFKSPEGYDSEAQINAFEDTWRWGEQAEREFSELLHQPNTDVAEMIRSLRSFLKETNMMAYLVIMASRLLELHRVLKSTGSLYLHCDPTASHYLRVLLDTIFSPEQFRNELIWRRTGSHNSSKRFGPIHDTILYYGKSKSTFFCQQKGPYTVDYIKDFFTDEDERGKYQSVSLTGPGTRTGDSGKPWHGNDPTKIGRHWQPASYLYAKYKNITGDDLANYDLITRFDKLNEVGLIHWGKKEDPVPRYKFYSSDAPGVPYQDIWAYQPGTNGCVFGNDSIGIDEDVKWLSSQDEERLGYPTQKPLGLLERIVKASSKSGDTVLDPFCGCGTAIHASHKLNREWIGIDITHLAITLIEKRLNEAFPTIVYEVHGTPKDLEGAKDLASRDKYEYQWWACSLINAQPYKDKKKGPDSGIDGIIYFQDDRLGAKKIVVSIKGGEHVTRTMIADLKNTVDREKAQIGLFITLSEPTKPMLKEATSAGYYVSIYGSFPKIQILTIENLLSSTAQPNYPDMSRGSFSFKKANIEEKKATQSKMDLNQ